MLMTSPPPRPSALASFAGKAALALRREVRERDVQAQHHVERAGRWIGAQIMAPHRHKVPDLRPQHVKLVAALEGTFAPGVRELVQAAPAIAHVAGTPRHRRMDVRGQQCSGADAGSAPRLPRAI